MAVVSVKQALEGKVAAGSEVTVRGWVRTRRDSKAGLSFVNVSDGSCFAPIQVVAPATLANYETEVKRLTASCSVIATGTLVASQGQGQSFEIQASRIEVVGWVEDPETYPIQPKAHSLEFLREVAHLRPRTNLFGAVTRIRHTHGHGGAPLLPRRGLLLGQHADHHDLGRRRRRADVPRLHPGHDEPAARQQGRGRFLQGLLRQGSVPDRVRPAQRRGLLPGAVEGLHLRPDLPRRELQHHAPPGRVLDDRAGNRLRRPRRRRATWPRTS